MVEGFDVGLEMSGNAAALHAMIDTMAHGGRIAMLGIPFEPIAIDWNKVVFDMLTIRGIYGREMYETWYQMTVMLQSGLDVKPVITHRFAWERYQEAFAVAARARAARRCWSGHRQLTRRRTVSSGFIHVEPSTTWTPTIRIRPAAEIDARPSTYPSDR